MCTRNTIETQGKPMNVIEADRAEEAGTAKGG